MRSLAYNERGIRFWLIRDEIACWVRAYFLREQAALRLNGLALPVCRSIRGYESFVAWYVDTERRLAQLPEQDRRFLLLAALGHSQLCVARVLKMSLRSASRRSTEALERWMKTGTVGARTDPPGRGELRAALREPRCDCRDSRPGRRRGANLRLKG